MTLTRPNLIAYTLIAVLLMVALLAAQVSFAQTTTGTTTGTLDTTSTTTVSDTTSPGLPNTGAGGNATLNLVVLTVSGLIALGGVVILARRYTIQ